MGNKRYVLHLSKCMQSVKIFASTTSEILCYEEKMMYFLNHVMEVSFTQ